MDNEAVYCHEYVSLRLAKVLKEKRYLIPTNHYYKEGKLLSCVSIKVSRCTRMVESKI